MEMQPKKIRCVEAYSSAGNVWQPGVVVEDEAQIPWLMRQAPSAWVADDVAADAPLEVKKVVRQATKKEA